MKSNKWRGRIIIGLIVLSAFFLRVYKVGSIPPSLSWDEVSIGYNAYSILKTTKDEHGAFFPLGAFAAYGDYKPPFAIYITVPFIAAFGLNEFSVRLPSVLFGTATVLIVYLLTLELLEGKKILGYLSAALLAFSPWHIQLSRAGFEANIALFWVLLGVLAVLAARRDKRFLVVSLLPFVVSIYTFNSARYFVPLLLVGLFVYAQKELLKNRRYLFIGIIIACISLLPTLPHLLSSQARLRFAEVNIFTDISVVETANKRIEYDQNSPLSKLVYNRRLGYLRSYLIHFADAFEPWFLFIRGDGNPKFSIQDVGQLYVADLPFLLVGLYVLLQTNRKVAWLLIFWLCAAVVPAAVARETPHALRIENSLPTWQLFTASGIFFVITKFTGARRKLVATAVIVLYFGTVSFYLHNYYSHYASEFSAEWQYGYREAIRYIQPIKGAYENVVLTEAIGRAYMYALFYEKFDPTLYRQTHDASFDAAGFYNVYGFDKYRFVRQGADELKDKTLYILQPQYVPGGVRILETIRLLNNDPVLVIFEKG